MWKFNKNYVINYGEGEVCIIDLSKRCLHCNPMFHTGSNYEPQLKNCNQECAIVYQGGKHNILFASQLNPDILVALTEKDKDKDWELTIWEKGQVRATLPFEGCKGFDLLNWRVDFLEHCTEVQGVKRHWFGRLTKDAKYVFIDLNDLKTVKSIEAPAAQCLAWVPNENKVALGTPQLVTIIDVDTDTWYSTMKFPFHRTIRCLTFSRSGQILFAATEDCIFACYWRAGLVIEMGMFSSRLKEIQTVDFVLDQILVVSDTCRSQYYKLKSKLDI
jgi:WD40 repeat protein